MKLSWSHVAFGVLGALATAGVMLAGSPTVVDYSPQVRQLSRELTAFRDTVARKDSTLAAYRLRLASRDSALERLRDREQASYRVSQSLASQNRRLADSLAKLHPELAPVLTVLNAGIASQDSACSEALNACRSRADSLRAQISERDSIVRQTVSQRDTALSGWRRTLAADSAAEQQAARKGREVWLWRTATVVALVLGWLH